MDQRCPEAVREAQLPARSQHLPSGRSRIMIFTSPHPPVEIPETTLTSFVLQRAEQNAAKVAITDVSGDREYTYGQLASAVRRAAGGLHARGFGKGDVLAMLTPNVPEYPIAFHAAALAGGTVVALNPLDTTDDLASRLNEAGASLLVTLPSELAQATALAGRAAQGNRPGQPDRGRGDPGIRGGRGRNVVQLAARPRRRAARAADRPGA